MDEMKAAESLLKENGILCGDAIDWEQVYNEIDLNQDGQVD